MPRIRTIKPELPHSESMGRVTRDARLMFILLFTLADDDGRLRGNSRMLASLLFPYDRDAAERADDWLVELEKERCILRYEVDGSSYLKLVNWAKHQRIDKPSASKLPEFPKPSRTVANAREASPLDQDQDLGSGPKDQEGKGEAETCGAAASARACDSVSGLPAEIKPSFHATAAKGSLVNRRGSRLPNDWKASAELVKWAEGMRPDLDIPTVVDRFRHYWLDGLGEKGVKNDWEEAFRRWVNTEYVNPHTGRSRTMLALEKLERELQE